MLYLIDGYNVTKQDPETRDLSLEDQRVSLERRLGRLFKQLFGKKATYRIVWDGAGGSGVSHRADANSQFTRMPTADDAIVAKVAAASEKIGVVTSDNGLAQRCRAAASHGVEIVPSSKLFARQRSKGSGGKVLPERKPRGRVDRISGDIGIPPNANKINEELKKIWGIED